MSHLYHNLRLHQVFGANTDVGKTILTTALCLASSSLALPSTSSTKAEEAARLRDEHERNVRAAMLGQHHGMGESVHYLKPVSTGPMEDSDDSHIALYASPSSEQTLLRFPHAVSPHLAARLSPPSLSPLSDSTRIPTDTELVRSIGEWISQKGSLSTSSQRGVAYIETAGGPHSPSPSGSSQIHLLRPLRLPTILIGDSKLGGISTTRSAYESLVAAGHQVDVLLLFTEGKEDRWGNAEYLAKWGEEVGLPVWPLSGFRGKTLWGGPPERAPSPQEEVRQMRGFYRGLVYGRCRLEGDESQVGGVVDVVKHLREAHALRIAELETLAGRTRESCWWPFTQHGLAKADTDVTVIDSAYGDFFSVFRQQQKVSSKETLSGEADGSKLRPLLDGSASWWTQCLGHSHPALAQAAARAAGRYGHVLFPMAANAPALRLAEGLLGRRDRSLHAAPPDNPAPGTGWADRVFFSDNGATGMEVALKMAIASTRQRYAPPSLTEQSAKRVSAGRRPGTLAGRPSREWKVIGLKGSYHGDTIGVMDASEPSVYSEKVDWYRGRGHWFDTPSIGVKDGKAVLTIPASLSEDGERPAYVEFDSLQAAYDVTTRLQSDRTAKMYRQKIRQWLDQRIRVEGERFGAVVIEPIVLGAGGMIFVDPVFQRCLVDVVRESEDLFSLSDPPLRDAKAPGLEREKEMGLGEWRGLPVIYDEVFTGLYRLGHSSPTKLLGTNPDISVLAKILTGGTLPMSVTLASKSIFETFTKDTERKVDALLHGHSYTAHPVGCEVANETMKIIEGMERGGEWDGEKKDWGIGSSTPMGTAKEEDGAVASTASVPKGTSSPGIWSFWSHKTVLDLSRSQHVSSVMAMGTVLVLELHDAENPGYSSTVATDLLSRLRLLPTEQQGHPSVPLPIPIPIPIPTHSSSKNNNNDNDNNEEAGRRSRIPFNIHARPLGNIVYFMCSLNTPVEVRKGVEGILSRELL